MTLSFLTLVQWGCQASSLDQEDSEQNWNENIETQAIGSDAFVLVSENHMESGHHSG